ncbi:hypothetical protein DRN52_09030 [Thermococci archaeon]|nr:MAG: hypothetical protein DRN52_09030 [Thermococci archaeon]
MEMVYLVLEEKEDLKHRIVYGIFKCLGKYKERAQVRKFYKVSKGTIVKSYTTLECRQTVVRNHTLITLGELGIEVEELPYELYKICKELEGYPKYEIKREKA